MTKPKLTVLEGGLLNPNPDRKFLSAYVTDTRLMGVLAIYAHWQVYPSPGDGNLHQFFYIDCEEMGLETYMAITTNNPIDISMTEQALIGGLGAKKKEITERQLRGLLLHYKEFNEKRNLPLPKYIEEYDFLFDEEIILSAGEEKSLMSTICTDLTSDYQVVNYFLMRAFGRDYAGTSYLADKRVKTDIYDKYHQATFCKNVIDKAADYDDGAISYLCESLVEMGGNYETVISEVIVKDSKVVDFRHCSGFKVSSAEAAMMLAKPEYVTVYESLLSDEDMEANLGELTLNLDAIMSEHDNGRMFMAFKHNNEHVNNRVFLLSNDVKGVYFLTDYGQLIASAYSLKDIRYLENKLKMSMLAPFLMTTAKYEFREPILFEFVQSDFEDFDDFLEFIRE